MSKNIVERIYEEIWGERRKGDGTMEIKGLQEEIQNALPGVVEFVEGKTEDEVRLLLRDNIVQMLSTHAKVNLAVERVIQAHVLYDTKNVRNKRSHMRKYLKEARAILELV